MSTAHPVKMQVSWIHAPRLHVFMYALLLIGTPFILLRNYLVQTVAIASASSFKLFGTDIRIVPLAALLVLLIFAFNFRKQITKLRLSAVAAVVLLDALAQQITDYYFGHNYYDLQQNWHYIAYGLYAYFIYRDLSRRNMPLYKVMLVTYFSALGLSSFDEFFQRFMSNRIFDICDIGKDVWGTLMGMIIVYCWSRYSQSLFKDWKNVRHKKLRDYYRHPFTLLLLIIVLSLIFLSVGSLLSESDYNLITIVITAVAFILFFAAWHFSQFKTGKIILLTAAGILLLVQGFSFIKYRQDNIVHTQFGITVYKGIPIPFFDILIYDNGLFRLVDKKHYFNQRDRRFFFKKEPDILLIASGAEGKGGQGLADPKHVFLYNPWTRKATQVIIQKTPDACETFNRLKREHKKVLLVIHNTC